MVSLSTIYGLSIVLGSLAAIGSAFVGTKVYPIQTGGDPLAGPTALAATVSGAFAAAEKAVKSTPEPLEVETVKEEPPVVEEEKPPVVEETQDVPPVSGGNRRPPPWFRYSGTKH